MLYVAHWRSLFFTNSLLVECAQSAVGSLAVSMLSVAVSVLCMSLQTTCLRSFTEPVIEYGEWVPQTENDRGATEHEKTQRSDETETNNIQPPRQPYQASSGYGAPASNPADCYLETGCSSSCGDGFRLLLPNKQAVACVPSVLQVLPCNERECPVDCGWDQWSTWTMCAQRSKRKTRSLSKIFLNDGLYHDDFTYVIDEFYGSSPQKRQSNYGSPTSGGNFPFCSQTRVRAVKQSAQSGGRECRGDRFEERYCRSTQCRGRFEHFNNVNIGLRDTACLHSNK